MPISLTTYIKLVHIKLKISKTVIAISFRWCQAHSYVIHRQITIWPHIKLDNVVKTLLPAVSTFTPENIKQIHSICVTGLYQANFLTLYSFLFIYLSFLLYLSLFVFPLSFSVLPLSLCIFCLSLAICFFFFFHILCQSFSLNISIIY